MQSRHHHSSRRWAPLLLAVATFAGSAALANPAAAQESPHALRTKVMPACPAAATANGRYVQYIYRAILDRCADADGQAYWTAQLDGGLARADFTRVVDMSEENIQTNNVDALYSEFINRAITASERTWAANSIRTDSADAVVIAVLSASDEYYNASHFTDDEWMSDAYNHILDRDPDAGGASYYKAFFGTHGSTFWQRLYVALAMEHSTENAGSWAGAVYFAGLDRPPTEAEVNAGIAWLQGPGHWQTFRLWTNLLASDEAYAAGSAVAPVS